MKMMSPFLVLALLILGAIASIILSWFRSRWAAGSALGVCSLALIMWLFAGTQPATATISGGQLAPWVLLSWSVDDAARQVSLLLLILVFSSLLLMGADNKLRWRWGPGMSLMLVSAGLLSLWADSLPTLLTVWVLLGLLWTLVLYPVVKGEPVRFLRMLGTSWIGVFLLGMGAANAPVLDTELLMAGSAWSGSALAWILAAVFWQLWVYPFVLHRFIPELAKMRMTAVMFATPAVSGAFLLFRLVDAGQASQGIGLILALAGLLTLLWGISRAWMELNLSATSKSGLWFALAGLLLLTAASLEGTAILQEIRVWLLAGGILLMAPALSKQAAFPHRLADRVASRSGPLVAIAAMAAFPFTAGFAAFSVVYDKWATGGYWLVLLVTLLLQVPLIAAGLSTIWPKGAEHEDTAVQTATILWRPLVARLALIIPALALLTPTGLAAASAWSWLAILLGLGGGLGLFVWLTRTDSLQLSLPSTFAFPSLPAFPGSRLQAVLGQVMALLHQAESILEGDRGLLWLLLLLALFLLVR